MMTYPHIELDISLITGEFPQYELYIHQMKREIARIDSALLDLSPPEVKPAQDRKRLLECKINKCSELVAAVRGIHKLGNAQREREELSILKTHFTDPSYWGCTYHPPFSAKKLQVFYEATEKFYIFQINQESWEIRKEALEYLAESAHAHQ